MSKYLKKKYKFIYFYRITNNINNHFYYGIHATNNLNDDYMGSGIRLKLAYNKYGIENFTKEILKYFDNLKEAYAYEAEIVSEELVNSEECYNLVKGGIGGGKQGLAIVKDKNNNIFSIPVNDPKYISREYVPISIGKVVVKDENNNTFSISVNDPRYLSGELKHIAKGRVVVKDENNNTFSISVNDPRYLSGELKPFNCNMCFYKDKNENVIFTSTQDERVLSGELQHPTQGRITVKDNKGNFYSVYKDDPRYLSGELVFNCKGHKLSEETKRKVSENHPDYNGEKNPMFGRIWYHKNIDGNIKNKPISKYEISDYEKNGWIRGRYITNYKNGRFVKNIDKINEKE